MVCRLWANEKNLADALRLGEYIKAQIKSRVGEWLHCSVGLSVSPFLAKVAAEMQKPNGLVVLDDEDLPHKLFGLKLRDFPGIGARMEARLNAVGIHTTEQMYAVDRDRMRRLWGGVVANAGGGCCAARRHPAAAPAPQPGPLARPAPRSADSARRSGGRPPPSGKGRRATAPQRLARARPERLCPQRGRREWCRKARFAPCQDTWMLMGLLRSLWEHPFSVVKQVGVVLYDLLPGDAVTPSLFDDRDRFVRAALAVDELNRRFGRGSVTMAGVLPAAHTAEDRMRSPRSRSFRASHKNVHEAFPNRS